MKYALVNGVVLNGHEDMTPQKDLVILVENERIVDIVDKDVRIDGYEMIDLNGQYIMPGLVNMHVHLPSTGKPKKKEVDNAKLVNFVTKFKITRKYLQHMCETSAKTQLLSGVTTIRTMGGVENYDSLIRDRILNDEIVGPRIIASNMAVSVPKGHMAGSLAYEASSAQEARDYVRKISKGNPDVIKLMITGGVLDAKKKGEPGMLKMSAEYVKAACDEAHQLGYKVAAHVESPEGVRVALENGVDTIEHGAMVDEDMIRLFKEKNACHIATLSPALPYALFDREISHVSEMAQYNGKIVFEGIVNCAKACLENGIPVGLGTDTGCPYITHYDMWRELNYFHKFCGVSNQFALYTATKQNAILAGLGDEIGTIDKGKCADMIVIKDNPLDHLEALRNVSMVIYRGHMIQNPQVKKMAHVERELDKFK